MDEITREQVEGELNNLRVMILFSENVRKRAWMDHALDALIAAWEREQETCKWAQAPDGCVWRTSCGRLWTGPAPGVATGLYRCFHCGRRIEEATYG